VDGAPEPRCAKEIGRFEVVARDELEAGDEDDEDERRRAPKLSYER